MVGRKGIPLSVLLTAANVHDSNVFEKLVDSIGPIKHPGRGGPRKRPEKLHADKGYDAKKCREGLRRRGIKARIARKGVESSERLGRHRCSDAHVGVAGPLPKASGALRAVHGYPLGVPPPRLRSPLPQLLIVRILQRT